MASRVHGYLIFGRSILVPSGAKGPPLRVGSAVLCLLEAGWRINRPVLGWDTAMLRPPSLPGQVLSEKGPQLGEQMRLPLVSAIKLSHNLLLIFPTKNCFSQNAPFAIPYTPIGTEQIARPLWMPPRHPEPVRAYRRALVG